MYSIISFLASFCRTNPHDSTISLEDGWAKIQEKGIKPLEETLELARLDLNEKHAIGKLISRATYVEVMTTIYNMCTQSPSAKNWSRALYDRYEKAMSSYVKQKIAPMVATSADLNESTRAITKFLVYLAWMGRFFTYLDRKYIPKCSLPTLRETGLNVFRQISIEPETALDAFRHVVIEPVLYRVRHGLQVWDPCDFIRREEMLRMFTQLGPKHEPLELSARKHLEIEIRHAVAARVAWILRKAHRTGNRLGHSLQMRQHIYEFLV